MRKEWTCLKRTLLPFLSVVSLFPRTREKGSCCSQLWGFWCLALQSQETHSSIIITEEGSEACARRMGGAGSEKGEELTVWGGVGTACILISFGTEWLGG